MANKPPSGNGHATAPKPEGNPAFRAMGLPRLRRIKLPSRNWLIFIGLVGSWTTALLYDRHHKKRAQQKWCHLVSHLAQEPLPANMMQRKITILLAAPPGDGLRVAREHFHEYIKPILVAGALDWEVIEGRREGEVRAGLAEKIRKLRRRNGEAPLAEDENEDSVKEAIRAVRQTMGCREWEGVQGDLVLGRHTWKEYVRGLHEGWLGPMGSPRPCTRPEVDEPSIGHPLTSTPSADAPSDQQYNPASSAEQKPESVDDVLNSELGTSSKADDSRAPESDSKPKPKPSPTLPYIRPLDYPSSPTAPTIPSQLEPCVALPLPHILGFLNTPKRMYRFLNRRQLANDTGASVAALVLASNSRPYHHTTEYISVVDPDEALPSSIVPEGAVAPVKEVWEQETVLKEAEAEWHKSAWKDNEEGDNRERVWKEDMVIDPRISGRMRAFELAEGAATRAEELEVAERTREESTFTKLKGWAGYGPREKKGWDMGLEGAESD
ncbi:MAG: hypothetical protein Q9217_000968 [Psora testacea]